MILNPATMRCIAIPVGGSSQSMDVALEDNCDAEHPRFFWIWRNTYQIASLTNPVRKNIKLLQLGLAVVKELKDRFDWWLSGRSVYY